jgi:TonB family protein
LPRTSTNLMVQFERYSPGDTGTTFVTRTPSQTGSDGMAELQNNGTDSGTASSRSNNSVVGSAETGTHSGVSKRYDGPVYVIQGNTKIDGRISRDDETPISGKVTRESSGEIPVSETIPEYPRFALRANMQGRVVLTAIIAKDGSLEDVRVLSSPSPLDGTVLEAVKTWRYQPHVENGKPVEAVTEVIVEFTITTKERRTGPEG